MFLFKKNKISFFCLLFVTLLLSSCEFINPDEEIPSFIKIDAINLTTDYSTEGSASHKITDVWIYVEDDIIGAFELPAIIPILKNGKHKITIKPGIQLNGTASTRAIYPFYNSIEKEIDLIEENITDLGVLSTTYSSSTQFVWKEDFDQGGISIENTSKSDTTIIKISNPSQCFEGLSGLISLNSVKRIYEGASNLAYVLPNNESAVFLELNYKTNNAFTVGLFINESSNTVQHPVVVINKSDEWKKIYINFTTVVSREINANDFKVFIGVSKEDDVDSPEILIDNIKLLHF